jgi:hypothetical protein
LRNTDITAYHYIATLPILLLRTTTEATSTTAPVSPAAAAVTECTVTEATVTKTGVTAAALRLRQRFRQRKLKPGDAVLARRRSGAGWYTAVVTGIASNGNYAVTYGASAGSDTPSAGEISATPTAFACTVVLRTQAVLDVS